MEGGTTATVDATTDAIADANVLFWFWFVALAIAPVPVYATSATCSATVLAKVQVGPALLTSVAANKSMATIKAGAPFSTSGKP